MEDFFNVKTVVEARKTLVCAWLSGRTRVSKDHDYYERVGLLESLGRVLVKDVVSDEDIPPYHRSTVDGFAVRSKDTFGASESLPAILKVIEDIPMGSAPHVALTSGAASRIPTGGVLPEGADACVMVEYTEMLDENTVLIQKPAFPGENIVHAGEDVAKDEVVVAGGTVLRPFDIGALAAVGILQVDVLKRPRIAVISTGDEIIHPSGIPKPGQMRDINTYSLSSAAINAGADVSMLGIAKDDYASLRTLVERGLEEADMVVVSGGSSVGVRDVTVKVFSDLGPPGVLVHGVALRPGKPVILGVCRGKPVFGLPGHPVSALTSFDLFVRFALNVMVSRPRWDAPATDREALALNTSGDLSGPAHDEHTCSVVDRAMNAVASLYASQETWIEAYLTRNVSSSPGRQDHVRVRLVEQGGRLMAEPVFGKSGLISVLSRADGEIVVPFDSEGLIEGSRVKVRFFPGRA